LPRQRRTGVAMAPHGWAATRGRRRREGGKGTEGRREGDGGTGRERARAGRHRASE
jgi:hypothetical protein